MSGKELAPAPLPLRPLPPQDRDSEWSVLGAAMTSPELADELLMHCNEKAFFYDANRWIFSVIRDLVEEGDTPDPASVYARLHAIGKSDQIGGSPYIHAVMGARFPSRMDTVCRHLVEYAAIRRAQAALFELYVETGQAMDDRSAWLEQAEQRVYAATTAPELEAKPAGMFGDVAALVLDYVRRAGSSPDFSGKRTGFKAIDEHIGGMGRGDLWIVGGRPGMGKSAWTCQVAEYRAACGDLVVFFGLEMNRVQLGLRSASRRSGVPIRQLRSGKLEQDEWNRLNTCLEEQFDIPLVIDDVTNLTPATFRAKLRRHVAMARQRFPNARLGLVAIDYLQLMKPDRQRGTRAEEVGEISRSLKIGAGDFDVPIMALSQLTRPAKGQKVPRPQLHDLRESGSIEQDADGVIFIHREDEYADDTTAKTGQADIIVAKGRNCGSATHKQAFDGRYTVFSDL